MRDFHTSRTLAILPLTVYVLGLAFGPVLSAPISERFGRKHVYLITPPLFMLFTLGAGFSQNLEFFRGLLWESGTRGWSGDKCGFVFAEGSGDCDEFVYFGAFCWAGFGVRSPYLPSIPSPLSRYIGIGFIFGGR